MNSRRNEFSAFIRIAFRTYTSINTAVDYSSTNARNDGDFRVERDTFLSEYLWHNDCSAIRLITPAGSNTLCTVSTVEERQACPVTEFCYCIGVVLAWAAGARTVQVVVLTLYEMECVELFNPTMVIFRRSRDFPLSFWQFIFNFGCIPGTSCCVRIALYCIGAWWNVIDLVIQVNII